MDYQGINNTLDQILISLRAILSSVKEEQKLISAHELQRVNHLVHERLDILALYEQSFLRLISYMSPSVKTDYAYEDQLDLLNRLIAMIPIDEVSLDYTIKQAKALIEEIHNQNTITAAFLQLEPLRLQQSQSPDPFVHVTVSQTQPKKKPIALQLLEEEELDELD